MNEEVIFYEMNDTTKSNEVTLTEIDINLAALRKRYVRNQYVNTNGKGNGLSHYYSMLEKPT